MIHFTEKFMLKAFFFWPHVDYFLIKTKNICKENDFNKNLNKSNLLIIQSKLFEYS